MKSTIGALFVGKPQTLWEGKPPSAIAKALVQDPVEVTELGLVTDQQADLKVHGGRDKALHHYAADHYPSWRSELNRSDLKPGSFGENLSSVGITDNDICIGDVLSIGSTTVQVSQGRQPCWKLNNHTGETRMAYLFQKTGRTGWYYRVLSGGFVAIGDTIELLDRPRDGWTVKRVTSARLTRKISQNDAAILAEMPELADGWRVAFARMAKGGAKDDTSARLQAP